MEVDLITFEANQIIGPVIYYLLRLFTAGKESTTFDSDDLSGTFSYAITSFFSIANNSTK
jgi:hypothetical protein